jgi:hypothetical protein
MVRRSGPWHLRGDLPSASLALPELQMQPAPWQVSFDTSSLTGWDSGLASFLLRIFPRALREVAASLVCTADRRYAPRLPIRDAFVPTVPT